MSEPKIDPELIASADPPAKLTHRFYLTAGPALGRLAFAEAGPDGAIRYHSAVAMSREDLVALAKTILKLIPDETLQTGNSAAAKATTAH